MLVHNILFIDYNNLKKKKERNSVQFDCEFDESLSSCVESI